MQNPIITALDVATPEAALALAQRVAPFVGGFKIGAELFTSAGPDIVRRVRGLGVSVFLDLKFHDIPNTVARSTAAAVRLDVQMLTVHAGGGTAMLRAAETAAQETAAQLKRPPPLVLAVTVLTSLDGTALEELGCGCDVARQVRRLAGLAAHAGIRGLVCSPLEVGELRREYPGMRLVTPGVRMAEHGTDDQKRTLNPRQALEAGADWLVIGRPIYGAPDPAAAAEKILKSLG